MRLFPAHSIKRKLIWIIMWTSGVALALAGTMLALNDLQAGKRTRLQRISTQADIVGANSTAALTFNEPLSAAQTLSALSADSPIVAAGIYGQNNTLFARYLRPDADGDLLPSRLPEDSDWFEDGYLHVFRPIVLDGERIGTVYLRADLRELYSQLKNQIMIIAMVLLLSSLVALLLSAKLQGMISGPILRLAATAKIISREKNYALRVEKQSQDELGTLTQAFNEMLAQIQERDEKLERHKAQLEIWVQERTADLTEANRRLEHQIAERKRTEERLREHQAELAHVARLSTMGEMASSIAHEVNQPLSAIANYASGCVRKLRSGTGTADELIEVLGKTAQQAERAAKVIHRIRTFVRKEAPKHTWTDLNDLVQEVMTLIEFDLQRAELDVRLELGEQLPLVLVDAIQIEQVILNLVRNAIEAMEDNTAAKGQLIIQTSTPKSDAVEAAISDTGHGLPIGSADQLLEPFFTTKSKGMGMGLSISHSIIEAYGGRLWATPNPQGGATFRFTLPVK